MRQSCPYPPITRSLAVMVVTALTLLSACSDTPTAPPPLLPITESNNGIVVELPGGVPLEFVKIPAGEFTMGATEEQVAFLESLGIWKEHLHAGERPAHRVEITRDFYLGKYELTQGQWTAVMGSGPWAEGKNSYVRVGADYPAVQISWFDLQEFVEILSKLDGGASYRLPTEAEWEYVCRAGTSTLWFFGDDVRIQELRYDDQEVGPLVDLDHSPIVDYAWFYDNAWFGQAYGHQGGLKLPNPWGLYDMYGNVGEWVQDVYSPTYYEISPAEDPQGPSEGNERVQRGGGFTSKITRLRSGSRVWNDASTESETVGARLVRVE